MADNNQGQGQYSIPPDLSSILATLAQFSGQQQQQQQQSIPSPSPVPLIFPPTQSFLNQHQPPPDPRLLNRSNSQTPLAAEPPQHQPQQPQDLSTALPALFLNHQTPQTSLPQHQRSFDPRPTPQRRANSAHAAESVQPSTPALATAPTTSQSQQPQQLIIDPATITEWSHGLRCVNKIALQNPLFPAAIKRMITNQKKHEMQWYSGRQDLKQMQARRAAGANEIQNILSSIGGTTAPTQSQSPEEKEAELAAYDMKVYRAQLQMQASMVTELKSLGVPFFGTNLDRIVDDSAFEPNSAERERATFDGESGDKWSPRISKTELLALQNRMVQFLEDMYKE